MPDEVDVLGPERRRQLRQPGEITLESALRADDQQPRSSVEERLIRVEEANHVLDLLVGDHAADEHHIGPLVVELPRDQPSWTAIEVREIRYHRQDGGTWKAERLEVPTVELRVAHRQIAPFGVG